MAPIKRIFLENAYLPVTLVCAVVVSVAGFSFWLSTVHAQVKSNSEKVEKLDQISSDVSYIRGYIKALQEGK